MKETSPDFEITSLGECRFATPLRGVRFAGDHERLIYDTHLDAVLGYLEAKTSVPAMEVAGPREQLFFNPKGLACGIVTCGGLCPGINDVIRAVVLSLYHHYGVRTVYGFRYGYEGLIRPYRHEPLMLTPESVGRIHEFGGTILGTSRGPQDVGAMVTTLRELGISILFAVGGDGTLRGAGAIAESALRLGLPISVIGIPKTIDNDISFLQKTFGFETAVAEAQRVTMAANSEAEAAVNGIGLVKLMGRDSGFIAAFTVLVSGNVNFCLVPEVPFSMRTFLRLLEERLRRRSHALIVVAEGAGQEHLGGGTERDASGNVKHGDIGLYLKEAITSHFRAVGTGITLKYIDPSYTIRSVPANPHDSAFCLLLGQCAVHAGMSGRTNMVVGFWNHRFTHVPIALAVSRRKKIDPGGELWSSVLASTGQPSTMND